MPKKGIFLFIPTLRTWWHNISNLNKIVLGLAISGLLITLGYYAYTSLLKPTNIAEVTNVPVTPPFTYNNNIYFETSSVRLSASSANIMYNGLTIRSFDNNNNPHYVYSPYPTPDPDHTNLNIQWTDSSLNFQLNLGFEATASTQRIWRVTYITTDDPYNGTLYWMPANPETNALFSYFSIDNPILLPSVLLTSPLAPHLKLQLNDLALLAFITGSGSPAPSPSLTPSPTPSISPSPLPSSSFSPYPSPSIGYCNRLTPNLVVTPQQVTVYPGQSTEYTLTITNLDSLACGSTLLKIGVQTPQEISYWVSEPSLWVAAGATTTTKVSLYAPPLNPWGETRSLPISFKVESPNAGTSVGKVDSYTLLQPPPQTFNLNLRLTGVPNNRAEGAKVLLKLSLRDYGNYLVSEPVTLSHLYDDVYRANFTLDTPLAPGIQYRLRVKGEKHVGIKQCNNPIVSTPCLDDDYLSSPPYTGQSVDLNLTDLPLPPGDLTPQDGKADYNDTTILKVLMGKPQDTLNATDKLVGDLNYDGFINIYDVFLMLKTMETRYDD